MNKCFEENKYLATKTYDLAPKIFWLVASWRLKKKVNFGPCFIRVPLEVFKCI